MIIATFYQFLDWPDHADWQHPLEELCQQVGLRGTILLSPEGINGMVAGSRSGIDALRQLLHQDDRFSNLEYKEAKSEYIPFDRLKIRLKPEIITFKISGIHPAQQTGKHVSWSAWNGLLADPEVVVLDTRNQYEVEIGTFEGAIDPGLASFSEFPDYVHRHLDPRQHRKIALFCTGGIRCEKASAWMLQQGFAEVYQLKGGILRYLQEIPPNQSRWRGECFVFDQRVKVNFCQIDG